MAKKKSKGELVLPPQKIGGKLVKGLTKTSLKMAKKWQRKRRLISLHRGRAIHKIMVRIHERDCGYTDEQKEINKKLRNKFSEGDDLCANICEIIYKMK